MGQLDQTLARHEVVGVDTSPFIYLWERHSRYFNLAATLFVTNDRRLAKVREIEFLLLDDYSQ